MQTQVEIGFEQLVQLAKSLPATQWTKLKEEVETHPPEESERENFRKLLINGPTFSQELLNAIAETRIKIDECL